MIASIHPPHKQDREQKLQHGAAQPPGKADSGKATLRFSQICLLYAVIVLACASCGGGGAAVTSSQGSSPAPSSPPGSPPAASAPPAVPSGVVLSHLEDSQWLTCGNCGNSNGGPAASYSWKRGISSPSEDGSSAEFSISSALPFANGYFFQEHAPISGGLAALTYEFDIYVPAGKENLPQAIEFECQQILNGWVYNFSWQAVYPSNTWRIFDYSLKRWDNAGVPFGHFAPGVWHHVMAEFHNDTAAHKVIHDAITVDGARHAVNIVHNAFHSGAARAEFTNAIQLDINAARSAYSVYVDQMKIHYR